MALGLLLAFYLVTLPVWGANPYIYFGAYLLCYGIAMPCLNISLQTLLSQVLGSGRQGFMQGVNIAVGSFTRVFDPLIMSFVFTRYGLTEAWAVDIGVLSLFLLIWASAYRRMMPPA